MKTITLYKAFVRCRDEKEFAVLARDKGDCGIAINKDRLARRWQRYNRLSQKLHARILQRLEDMP